MVHENEGHYPELRERKAYITKVIRTEEENFAKTLDAGMKIYDEMLASHKAQGETVFSGADAFKLYDTYGFPIDLTMEMAEEAGMTVDEAAFRALMEEQKVRARKAREALGDLEMCIRDSSSTGRGTRTSTSSCPYGSASGWRPCCGKHWPRTVSYTHLDVYKRQPPRRSWPTN